MTAKVKDNVFLKIKLNLYPVSAVDELKKKLISHGFKELSEKDPWSIQPLNKVIF